MIPQYEFYQALKIALHMAPDSHERHPALASLLVECSGVAELRLIGSDGERIVVVTLDVAHGQPVNTVMRLQPEEARGMLETFSIHTAPPPYPECNESHSLTLCFMGSLFMVTNGVDVATCTALDDGLKYPDYRAVMHHKTAPPVKRTFLRKDMAEALVVLVEVAEAVRVDVNGLLGPGYLEAVLVGGLTAIKSVIMGFSPIAGERVESKAVRK